MSKASFIARWMIITALLLASVVVVDVGSSLLRADSALPAPPVAYSSKDMWVGVLSESARALLLCHLFPHLRDASRSLWHAIRYGLVISALIGMMWLVVGYGSFELKHPSSFLLNDTVILLLQGILSGGGLYVLRTKHS